MSSFCGGEYLLLMTHTQAEVLTVSEGICQLELFLGKGYLGIVETPWKKVKNSAI